MFFSKSVLQTQHEKIVLYPEPITDLLLAIDRQGQADMVKSSRVYWKWIHIHRPNGEKVQVQVVIDSGAMRNTMCLSEWQAQKHRLMPLTPSGVTLSVMDNLRIVS